ncbi:MAG: S1 family peptidase [Myxococcaceae bacterium]|nr:S1 family peptidase [Myxococcaceae bacterium]
MRLRIVVCHLCVVLLGCEPELRAGPEAEQLDRAVLGGTRDELSRSVLALFIDPPLTTGVGFCTAFLIAPNVAMTARHCVSDMNQAGVFCADETVNGVQYTATRALPAVAPQRLTLTDIVDPRVTAPPELFTVAAVATPPQADGQPNCGHDVALLRLDAPRSTGHFPLADAAPVAGQTFTAIGYGYDGADGSSDGIRRQRSGLNVMHVGEARGTSGRIFATANDWVAELGPCGGDSGGPALDGAGRIIGVMSRGNPQVCRQMLYTQVAPFFAWSAETVRAMTAAAQLPAPAWATIADAGVDAGEPDAGVDAGEPDARVDAGEPDAGVDAGEPDAGVDAGEPDAGSLPPAELGPVAQPGCSSAPGPLLAALALVALCGHRSRRAAHLLRRRALSRSAARNALRDRATRVSARSCNTANAHSGRGGALPEMPMGMTNSTRSVVLSSFVAIALIGSGCGVQHDDDPGLNPDALTSSERALGATRRQSGETQGGHVPTADATTTDVMTVDAVKAPCSCDTFGRTTNPCPAQPTVADLGKWCGGGVTTPCPQAPVCNDHTCRFKAYNIQERIAAGVPRYDAVLISDQIGWCK